MYRDRAGFLARDAEIVAITYRIVDRYGLELLRFAAHDRVRDFHGDLRVGDLGFGLAVEQRGSGAAICRHMHSPWA